MNWIKRQLKKAWKWILGILGVSVAVAMTFNGAVEPINEESLFAELDADGTVLRVIVIDEEVLNTGKWGDPSNWVRTYYDGRLRGNYAGKGYKYDKDLDGFISPKPSPDPSRGILDWVLDTQTLKWKEVK